MTTLIAMILIFIIFVISMSDLILRISKKLNRKVSSYLTFGIATVLSGLIVSVVALYDILTPGGDLNGMFGQILLLVYIPTVIVMIIGDIIVWRITIKNKNKDGRQPDIRRND